MASRSIREEEVSRKLRKQGWRVFHSGLPDFLCIRSRENGRGYQIKWVEVKVGRDKQSKEQEKVANILRECGFRVEIREYPFLPWEEQIIEYLRNHERITANEVWKKVFGHRRSLSYARYCLAHLKEIGTISNVGIVGPRKAALYSLVKVAI